MSAAIPITANTIPTNNTIPNEKIITSSVPTSEEVYLPPPGLTPTEPVKEEVKTEAEKIKWDWSKLLEGGTLGDLAGDLHHGVAIGTDWYGWELEPEQKARYDKILSTILEPLLEHHEYIGLVVGILSIVSMEGMKIGGYLKFNKERKGKEEVKKKTVVTTATTVSPPTIQTFDQGRIAPAVTQTAPPVSNVPTQAVNFTTGQNLDANLPPIGGVRNLEPNTMIPPMSAEQAKSLRPPSI